MIILFICKWNAGRSQIAEALFNKYSKSNKAISAGTHAAIYSGTKLSDVVRTVIKCMNEVGLNLSDKIQKPLTKQIVGEADRIIILTEKKDLPPYVLKSKKVTYWNVEDGAGKGYEFHVKMRNQIENLVKCLVREVG